MKEKYYVVSFSGGKDSTAMLLELIRLGRPIDEVINFDNGLDFPAMREHIERIKKYVESCGIKFTTIKSNTFTYYLYEHKKGNRSKYSDLGYGFPSNMNRWCTREKITAINKYFYTLYEMYDVYQYVGIAYDELFRLKRKNNQRKGLLFPLVAWRWTEKQCLEYCFSLGYDFGNLYSLFSRVSCWCCPLQPLSELYTLYSHFPELWEQLKTWQDKTFNKFTPRYSVHELEHRFILQEKSIYGITTKKDILNACSCKTYQMSILDIL